MEKSESCSSSSLGSLGSDRISSISLYNKPEIGDKGFAPIDIEIQIQNERILAIFLETINKTEIAVFLALCTLKEINFAIRDVISKEHFQFLRQIFSGGKIKVESVEAEDKFYTPITKEKIQEVMNQPDPKILPELSQIIKVLLEYPKLQPVIQREIQWFRHISEKEQTRLADAVLFLDSLVRFKNRMEDKLNMSAVEKLKKEIVQRNLNRTNKAFKEKINDISKRLKDENTTFNHIYKQKDAIINNHREELDMLKNECVTVIKKKILDSERKMMRETETHQINYEALVDKERDITETYESLLKRHMDSEKALRAKRFKVETQLLNWLRKYDQEVGDKQNELDQLTQNYEDEKNQLAELQRQFDEQELIYKPLMADKEAEYQAELAIKVDTFRLNYAARKIQRYWRKILAAEAAKKKKKKRGKK